MLFVLLILFGVRSNAQSTYPIQDTVANVAPHIPSVSRYSGSGPEWHGEHYSYTMASQDDILAWVAAYPAEAAGFQRSIGSYLGSTDVTAISTGEAEVYYDLKAAWMMVVQK